MFQRGKAQQMHKADNLNDICELTVYKMWDPRHQTTLWASKTYYRDSFTSRFLPLSNKSTISFFYLSIITSLKLSLMYIITLTRKLLYTKKTEWKQNGYLQLFMQTNALYSHNILTTVHEKFHKSNLPVSF
jgi:hypothetical protein